MENIATNLEHVGKMETWEIGKCTNGDFWESGKQMENCPVRIERKPST